MSTCRAVSAEPLVLGLEKKLEFCGRPLMDVIMGGLVKNVVGGRGWVLWG